MESLLTKVMEVDCLNGRIQFRREWLQDNACLKAMLQVARQQRDKDQGHEKFHSNTSSSMLQEAKGFSHVVLNGVAQHLATDVFEFFGRSNPIKVFCQQECGFASVASRGASQFLPWFMN